MGSLLPPEGYDVVENLFWRNRILGPEGKDLVFTTIADKPLDRPLGMLLMQLLLHVCFYPRFTRPLPKVDMGNPFVHGYPHLMPDVQMLAAGFFLFVAERLGCFPVYGPPVRICVRIGWQFPRLAMT